MFNARNTVASVLVVAAILTTAVAGPASARPEAPPAAPAVQSPQLGERPLERIGDQFVRGDDLTGAGVPAPAWIPEQG